MTLNEERVNEFVGRFAGDLGAVLHAATVPVGDRLGPYAEMGDSLPVTSAQLAERTGYPQRYLAEWLAAQAASGYAEYDPETQAFRLTEEQAFALTSPDNPLFAPGGLQSPDLTFQALHALGQRRQAQAPRGAAVVLLLCEDKEACHAAEVEILHGRPRTQETAPGTAPPSRQESNTPPARLGMDCQEPIPERKRLFPVWPSTQFSMDGGGDGPHPHLTPSRRT